MKMSAVNTETTKPGLRAHLYKILGTSFLYPTNDLFDSLGTEQWVQSLLRYCSVSGSSEVRAAVHELCGLLKTGPMEQALEYEYNRLFAHLGSAKCPPYETEYGYENVFQKTQAMADIAGFYRAYGLDVADVNTERVDFISTELEFMSYLSLQQWYAEETNNREQLEICVDTQRKFLNDHLGRWVTVFTKILTNTTANRFYLAAGRLTALFLQEETARLKISVTEVEVPRKDVEKAPEPFGCDGCGITRTGDAVEDTIKKI